MDARFAMTKHRMSRGRLAALLGAASISACSARPLTEVIVHIDSDLSRDQMDAFAVRIKGARTPPTRGPFPLREHPLPATFGLVPSDDGFDHPVTVSVDAMLREKRVLTATSSFARFEKDRTMHLFVFLAASCISSSRPPCAERGMTCRACGCEIEDVPLEASAPSSDASCPLGVDAGAADGATFDAAPPSLDTGMVFDASPPIDGAMPDSAVALDAATLSCPPGYSLRNGSWYRSNLVQAKWTAANADCNDDGVGTHLAVLERPEEADVLRALIPTSSEIFFGLTLTGAGGAPIWVTGDPVTYQAWRATDTPAADDDCVELEIDGWDGTKCTSVNEYVCECDGKVPIVH